MKLTSLLTEASSNNVIVVDVQPEYKKWIHFDLYDFCEFLGKQKKILYFFNGPDTVGGDSKEDIMEWLWDHDFPEEKFRDIQFVDKGYGFLRDWMDYGVDESTIKKTLRHMARKNISDSRDIDPEEIEKDIPGISEEEYFESESIGFPSDINLAQLKRFSGAFIVGGGKDQCLKEVQILMSTFNIKAKEVKKFIY